MRHGEKEERVRKKKRRQTGRGGDKMRKWRRVRQDNETG